MKQKELFCNDENFRNNIIKFYREQILGDEISILEISKRYKDMIDNYDVSYKDWNFNTDGKPFNAYNDTTSIVWSVNHPKIKNILKDCSAIGVDLPTWYNWENSKKKIMIIAQDPLRSVRYYGGGEGKQYICHDLVISSPFATHDAEHRKTTRGRLYFEVFSSMIEDGYGVYLTDIKKVYVGNPKKFNHSVFDEQYKKALAKEIEIVTPDLIITWGKQAALYFKSDFDWFKIIEKSSEVNCRVLPMVHPSPMARTTPTLAELLKNGKTNKDLIKGSRLVKFVFS